MRARSIGAIAVAIASTLFLLPAGAYPGMMGHHMATHHTSTRSTRTMKCPVCGMTMNSYKTAAAPKRVHVGSHYYYCCTKCGYNGSHTTTHHMGTHMGTHHTMGHMGA